MYTKQLQGHNRNMLYDYELINPIIQVKFYSLETTSQHYIKYWVRKDVQNILKVNRMRNTSSKN